MTAKDEARQAAQHIKAFHRGFIDRREFIMLSGGITAAAFLAACSNDSGGRSGAKTIPLHTTSNDPSSLAFFKSAIDLYRQDHPDVEVTLSSIETASEVPYITNAFRTGQDLGLFSNRPEQMKKWIAEDRLLPIDDIVADLGADDFLFRNQANGHDYSLPFEVNATGLWYRTDLLADVGIHTPPATYDDLISALREVHGRNGQIGIMSGVGESPTLANNCLGPYVWQSGWGYFDKQGQLTFNQPEVFDGIRRYLEVMRYTAKSSFNIGYPDLISGYLSGRVVFSHYPGRLGAQLVDQGHELEEVTGFMPEPAGPFMTGSVVFSNMQSYVIDARTEHPAEAQDFLKFLFSGDNGLRWALVAPGHAFPGLKSVQAMLADTDNPIVQENAYLTRHPDWMSGIAQLLETGVNETVMMGAVNNHTLDRELNSNPWAGQIFRQGPIDATMIQEIGIRGTDPAEAWRAACDEMRTVADEYKAANPDWQPDVA